MIDISALYVCDELDDDLKYCEDENGGGDEDSNPDDGGGDEKTVTLHLIVVMTTVVIATNLISFSQVPNLYSLLNG